MSHVKKHFDSISKVYDNYKKKNSYYYDNLKNLLKSLIPKEAKVLEIGCGTGDILTSLLPKKGYGMDISSKMIAIAKHKHKKSKNLRFSTEYPREKYDYIFMTDVIEHLENPETVFKKISTLMHSKSIFVNTMANPIWEPLLMFWEKMGWKMPEGPHKRLTYDQIIPLLNNAGMTVTKHGFFLLLPVYIPKISKVVNSYLLRFFERFAFIEYLVAAKT